MDYRRIWHPGGTYFFTINLLQRKNNDLLIRHIQLLRDSIKTAKADHPFKIHGWVVLPEHMHCLIELPENDTDYATRIRLIKIGFSKAIPKTARVGTISGSVIVRMILNCRGWFQCRVSARQPRYFSLLVQRKVSKRKDTPDAACILRSEGFERGFRKGCPSPPKTSGIPAAPLRADPSKPFGARRGKRGKNPSRLTIVPTLQRFFVPTRN
ncbi:hypothetical protein PL263_13560 [Methylomonas sp. EFPC3]|uniref:REP-associated tyrosine transposase n=1 Tax=Methylomonas sp. EFPC3 TaxID=3021710 RepID=UPI002417E0CF|nr:hypothetical protein [Methylomonas sp. EFPC3]WFP49122.1 hypothetical protein PL263_13560 [Methylomonas sp. EFPC3]